MRRRAARSRHALDRAARWLAEKTSGTAAIAELQGTPGSAPAIDRKKGFEEVLAQHPGMKIVKSQSGEFTRAKGKEEASSLQHRLLSLSDAERNAELLELVRSHVGHILGAVPAAIQPERPLKEIFE